MAPVRDFMWVFAHLPKAAEPPARLISATMMPSITRNINIPDVPATDSISPFLTSASTASTALKLA